MSKKTKEPLYGKCVRCLSFVSMKRNGVCVGNSEAYKEMTGKTFSRGAPEGPFFIVKRLDGCSHWRAAW